MTMTGKQRLRQIRAKNRIISQREMRDFMAGKVSWLPCTGDREDAMICAEFERVYAMGFAAGRRALHANGGGEDGR